MTKKHGCVIVHNNSILTKGYNYRVYKTTKSHTKYSIHAEESAILKLNSLRTTKTLQTLNMYVVRIQDNELRLSLPCKKCTELINKNNSFLNGTGMKSSLMKGEFIIFEQTRGKYVK